MKFFAREFLWFITAIILALPVSYLFIDYLALTPSGDQSTIYEQTFEMELFITGAIIGFIFDLHNALGNMVYKENFNRGIK